MAMPSAPARCPSGRARRRRAWSGTPPARRPETVAFQPRPISLASWSSSLRVRIDLARAGARCRLRPAAVPCAVVAGTTGLGRRFIARGLHDARASTGRSCLAASRASCCGARPDPRSACALTRSRMIASARWSPRRDPSALLRPRDRRRSSERSASVCVTYGVTNFEMNQRIAGRR
jgi:hypothetical protein